MNKEQEEEFDKKFHTSCEDCFWTKEGAWKIYPSKIKTFINKLLKEERERIKEIVVCADRIYTDEHDRSVANEYKTQILKQL